MKTVFLKPFVLRFIYLFVSYYASCLINLYAAELEDMRDSSIKRIYALGFVSESHKKHVRDHLESITWKHEVSSLILKQITSQFSERMPEKEKLKSFIKAHPVGSIVALMGFVEANLTIIEAYLENSRLESQHYNSLSFLPMILSKAKGKIVDSMAIYPFFASDEEVCSCWFRFADPFYNGVSKWGMQAEVEGGDIHKRQRANEEASDVNDTEKISLIHGAVIQLDLSNAVRYLVSNNLYGEWQIWSKCFGEIILVNGPSSSGKSTVLQLYKKFGFVPINLDDVWPECYYNNIISSECIPPELVEKLSLARTFLSDSDILNILSGSQIKEESYTGYQLGILADIQYYRETIEKVRAPTYAEVYAYTYCKSQEFVFAGRNVVIEAILIEDIYFDLLLSCFRGYPLKFGLLYSSLQETLKKCFVRNYKFLKGMDDDYRYPSQVMNQYADFYKVINQESITKGDRRIGKVDGNVVKNLIEIAICCERQLLNFLRVKRVGTVIRYDSEGMLEESVKKLKNLIKIGSEEEIFIAPTVKYDFIIPPHTISKKRVKHTSIQEMYLDNRDVLRLKEAIKDSCYLARLDDNKEQEWSLDTVVNVLDISFLVFINEETLPIIVGSGNRFIMEVEYKKGECVFKLIGKEAQLLL